MKRRQGCATSLGLLAIAERAKRHRQVRLSERMLLNPMLQTNADTLRLSLDHFTNQDLHLPGLTMQDSKRIVRWPTEEDVAAGFVLPVSCHLFLLSLTNAPEPPSPPAAPAAAPCKKRQPAPYKA